jgi:phenylalanyl-tRNA synthetase beta chain
MPTITVNKRIFEKLVGRKLPIEKLKDRISYLGTDLESIENNEINVEIFPDRPDMLSVQGFARAFSSFIGVKTGLRKYKVNKSKHKVIVDKSLGKIRPYTVCAIIKGLKFDDEKIKEIIQIQEKLHVTYGRNRKKVAIGIYPFEKIKTPIRFLAKKPEEIKFRPLEFPKELNGRQILSKHPAGREYAYLLEGFDRFPFFIDANNNVLSMPPIINSHITGKITEKTKDVFVECSGFDFKTLSICLNIIVTALADMGGKIYSMELHYPDRRIITPNLKPSKMKIDINYVNKLLGVKLKDKDIKKYLERMGYDYKNKIVFVPPYRNDVLHQVDLVEDIAIAYGYDNFKEEIPNVATIGEENRLEIFKNKIAEVMVGLGFLEVSNYCLTSKEILNDYMNVKIDYVEVEESSTEYNALRTWLVPGLMKIFKENKHYEYPQKIFEIGTIFKKNNKEETGIEEALRIGFVSTHKDTNFTEVKQIIDVLFRSMNVGYEIIEVEHNSFIPGRVGRIVVKGKKVGYIGEIHPAVLERFGLKMPVSAFEINLSDLFVIIK